MDEQCSFFLMSLSMAPPFAECLYNIFKPSEEIYLSNLKSHCFLKIQNVFTLGYLFYTITHYHVPQLHFVSTVHRILMSWGDFPTEFSIVVVSNPPNSQYNVNPISICSGSEGTSCSSLWDNAVYNEGYLVSLKSKRVCVCGGECFSWMLSLCMHAYYTIGHSLWPGSPFPSFGPTSLWQWNRHSTKLYVLDSSLWKNQRGVHWALQICFVLYCSYSNPESCRKTARLGAVAMISTSFLHRLFCSFCFGRFTTCHSWCYFGEHLSVPLSQQPFHLV